MSSPRDLRRRIKSVSSTAQITRAMQMVAASKMRKAQEAALADASVRAPLYRIQRRRDDARPATSSIRCSRLARSEARGDSGRRGQGSVRRAEHERVPRRREVRPGVDRLHHRGPQGGAVRRPYAAASCGRVHLRRHADAIAEARAIAAFARELFLNGEVDEVQVVATRFVNTLTQTADHASSTCRSAPSPVSRSRACDRKRTSPATRAETLFEPSAEDVLGYLLPALPQFRSHFVLLNAKASEQSARMVAMKNATDNAEQLIKDLTPRIQQAPSGQHHARNSWKSPAGRLDD